MLRRPWHIWLAYLLILALLLPGFAWLTLRVLDLDRQEQLSRRRADQEKKVSLALWRMESVAMPIIAAEAARPHSAYQPYQTLEGAKGVTRIPSPLLRPPSEYVVLSFEVGEPGQIFSPQCPSPPDQAWALQNGLTPEIQTYACAAVETLERNLEFEALLSQLPVEELPAPSNVASRETAGQGGESSPESQTASPYVQNANAYGSLPDPLQESPATQDFRNRSMKLNTLAQQSAKEQRSNFETAQTPVEPQVREGASRSLWVGDKLILARRVLRNSEQLVQGCWLNWDRLQQDLRTELDDLLPGAELRPVDADQPAAPARMLASIPVELVVPPLTAPALPDSPTSIALYVAWGGLLFSCVAIGFLLYGVTSLSERRAAFVSAVTHELRTPLTTFQLYTEMLTGGMVADEENRREYLGTLHREAGRLSHLIDNVLAYARLERRPARRCRETMTVGALLERTRSRLEARAAHSGMQLECQIAPAAVHQAVHVEPTVIEQILLNLVDNACKYGRNGADPRIALHAERTGDQIELQVSDHGPGVPPDAARRLFRPFSKSDVEAARSAPGLGLGLALSRQLARSEGGDLQLRQAAGAGAAFVLTLPVASDG
jgi:anti-sigma regulatory factor (Ser/Thr protein kinase)